jgi:serine/threonine protein kinase/formylglycine-generating enzyme required for sulfatase activity
MDDPKPAPADSPDPDATVRAPAREVVFNRYELVAELGKGGMGIVWLALDRELNSKVALKFLRDEMTSEEHALKELKSEVILNRDLSHPHIIKTFDFVTNGKSSAISMEYVSGDNLHRAKTQKPERCFDVEEIAAWVYHLCDAMHYAHQQKVVHRDIKPANLMLSERNELKVGDFGIGRTVADTVNRVTRNTAGTPPYMSPQQTMGEKATPQDDIYSIGATIYDLLTGEPPFFRGAIREQALSKVANSMTDRRRELGRTGKPIPPAWEQAVAACLAKDAAARPASAKALRELLEGKARGAGAKGGRGLVWAGVAATVVLAAAGGAYWKISRPAPVVTNPSAAGPKNPGPGAAPGVGAATPASANVSPSPAPVSAAATPAPAGQVPANGGATATAPVPVDSAGKTAVDDLVDAGRITAPEAVMLNQALRNMQGEYEKTLAARLVVEKAISPDDWRSYSTLVATTDETVAKLRPLLATGVIRENEFGWLRAALAGTKGEDEKTVAQQLVETKSLPVEEWRTRTDLYPAQKRDPLMEKILPLAKAGAIAPEEAKWLRDALAGGKSEKENALAKRLIDEKAVTPGQWRALTEFNYALKDGAPLDPAQLPRAIDLALNATTGLRALRIEPGSFVRGTPLEEPGRRANELAPERVTIAAPFYIGMYEVTQAQYTAITSGNLMQSPSFWRARDHGNWPIDQVDWRTLTGSSGFLAKLNQILAAKYGGTLVADLPTEEEWEYACRAGTLTTFNNGRNITNTDTDPALDQIANYNRAANGSPRPVGSLAPNAWGLYDMHGNVSEWCQNRYWRGGSWSSKAAFLRPGWRNQISPDAQPSNQVGFRLVLRYKNPASGN